MSPIEDRIAAEKVLAGDVDAFEGIVRRWQAPLVNLAYRFCRDRGRAEEMAQMAFMRAYRALVTSTERNRPIRGRWTLRLKKSGTVASGARFLRCRRSTESR